MNASLRVSSQMELSHLPLRPSTQQLLQTRGFQTVQEVFDSYKNGLSNFSAELGTNLTAAGNIWKEILQQTTTNADNGTTSKENHYPQPAAKRPKTAHEILFENPKTTPSFIVTFCRQIDQMLEGGIARGELTELVGLPGTGKTQFGMQLSVNTTLPSWVGGVAGDVCYIDTEGSFSPERCHDMAVALIEHVQRGPRNRGNSSASGEWNMTPERILERIHVVRAHDLADLQATIQGTLPKLAEERAKVGSPLRLVVVDSIAFPVRAEVPLQLDDTAEFYMERNRHLTLGAQKLAQLATDYELAVVAINQMTTKFMPSGTSTTTTSVVAPALGESWAHTVTTRLMLSRDHNDNTARTCALVKSPRLPVGSAQYQVQKEGIRGYRPASS